MKRIFSRKRVVFLAVLAVAGITAIAAYAYFSTTGTGTGTATVGTSTVIALSGSPVDSLYPGGADASVTVNVQNNGSGNEYVGTITGSVADNGQCLGSWFVVDPITFNKNVTHGTSQTALTNVRMTDSGTNQDACKGQTMTINWSSN